MYDCDNDNAFFIIVWLVLEVIRTVRWTVCCRNRHSPDHFWSLLHSLLQKKAILLWILQLEITMWQSEKMIKSLTFFKLREHFYYKQGSG